MEDNFAILLTGTIGVITTVISGWTSWFFARKKYNSEVDNQLISNMKESLDFYKNLSDDNKERLTQVLEQNRKISEQNAMLLEQNTKLENKIKQLETQIKELADSLSEMKTAESKAKGKNNKEIVKK